MSIPKSLKIALIVSSLEVGGVETYLKTLADHLRTSGHEVSFIETQRKGRWSDEFRKIGHKVLTLTPQWHESIHQYTVGIGNELSQFDALFLNNSPLANPALGLLPANVLVLPVLHLKLPGMIANAIANFKECSQVVIISPTLQKSIEDTGVVPKDNISLICNGVDVQNTYPRENKRAASKSNLHIGYLGRIEHSHKGVLNIPTILRMYEGEKDTLKLSIIGDGPDMNNLKQGLATTCPWLKVQYHGYIPNKEAKDILATFDVLLMPSYYEGLPIALLEAMALGVIPLVSRLPGSTDIVVKDGKNGFIADPDDYAVFASALSRLDNEVTLRSELSKNAWKTIADDFNAEKMAGQYITLTNRLLHLSTSRKCSGVIQTDLLGEFPNTPIFLAIFFRKLRTLYHLMTMRQTS